MGEQVLAANKKYSFPAGSVMESSLDGMVSWDTLGVFENGIQFTHNWDGIEVEPGNVNKTRTRVKNPTLALAPSNILSWNTENWAKFSGGLYTNTNIAGTLVSGADEEIDGTGKEFEQILALSNQNSDGSAVTVNSVSGATDGSLVLNTDYRVLMDSNGNTGIAIIDSATVTTMDQVFTVNIDYTPATGSYIEAGHESIVLTDFAVRVRHYTDDALSLYDREMLVYSVRPDSGISFNEKGINEDGLDVITMAFTARNATGYTDGRKLFKYYIGAARLTDDS